MKKLGADWQWWVGKKKKHKTYGNCLPISRECGCGGPNNCSLNQLFQ